MVKTSVIVPVYNRGELLKYTIHSLLNQTEKDIEIILVDDFSTDNSYSVMQEIAKEDSRIKIVKNKIKGAGAARNEGLKYVNGETLMFLDSDDLFHPDMIKTVYESYKKENADIVCFDLLIHKIQDWEKTNIAEILDEANIHKSEIAYSLPPSQKDYLFMRFQLFCWNKLYKTTFIFENKLSFMNIKFSNDIYFVFLALAYSNKTVLLDKAFVLWYRHNNTITAKRCADDYIDFEIYKEIEEQLKKRKLKKFLRPLRCVRIRSCLDALSNTQNKNDFLEILKIIRKKLKTPFFEFIFNLPKVDYLGTNYRRVVFILKYAPVKVLIDFLILKKMLKSDF